MSYLVKLRSKEKTHGSQAVAKLETDLALGVLPDSEDAKLLRIDNPADTPKQELIVYWKEALVNATIITPKEYLKGIKSLCEERRGIIKREEYMSNGQVINMTYELPLSELITNFFDMLKSLSQGYASLDYEHSRYEESDIRRVTFYLNGEAVDALTFLVHE